ncbi:transposase family protein [Streptomyces sp. NPDC051776]|uniref:transposase family protein n=1 Tax=Streptomyces sp. NPDC051776 TaxID=3155414 RepID=UPI00343C8C51
MFTDRLLITLICLRHQLPHAALAELYRVDRSTVSAAVREIRPLLAAHGFAVPGRPGIRLKAIEDVFAYAEAEDIDLRIDGTETQVRRPRAHRPGRRAFVSGKRKQNTVKTTTFSDRQGRVLFSGVVRPGPDARPDLCTQRGHRRAAPPSPHGEGQGRRRLPGPGERVPRPDLRPASAAAEPQGHAGHRVLRLAGGQAPPVLGEYLRRATPTPSSGSGARSSGTSDAAKATATPTPRSPPSSPTAPRSDPPESRPAPTSCPSATRPAESPTNRTPRPACPDLNCAQGR